MNNPEDIDWEKHADTDTHPYKLRLFVTGASYNSRRAIINLKSICELHLKDGFSLEIIDVYQEKSVAEKEQIIALPLLVKYLPLPERRLIGDLSDTRKVLKCLGLVNET
jgi:circadian clock protein KaiB